MKTKKGLSAVVTNVLIILLVVIAVGILWAFVRPIFMQSGEKMQQTSECIDMELEVVKCAAIDTNANVTVSRGPGTANLGEIKLIFEKEDGSSEAKIETDAPDALETNVYKVEGLESSPTAVSVAGGIENEDGEIAYCTASTKVNC